SDRSRAWVASDAETSASATASVARVLPSTRSCVTQSRISVAPESDITSAVIHAQRRMDRGVRLSASSGLRGASISEPEVDVGSDLLGLHGQHDDTGAGPCEGPQRRRDALVDAHAPLEDGPAEEVHPDREERDADHHRIDALPPHGE